MIFIVTMGGLIESYVKQKETLKLCVKARGSLCQAASPCIIRCQIY